MDFKDKIKATGHVEIIKINHLTNVSSVVYEDPNVITGGLGRSIAQFMSTSGCVIDPCPTDNQQFGPRNSIVQSGGGEENSLKGENRGGRAFASKMAESQSQSEEDEYCCIGIYDVHVEGSVGPLMWSETGGSDGKGGKSDTPHPRLLEINAAVRITFVTTCQTDYYCDPARGYWWSDTCEEGIKKFNDEGITTSMSWQTGFDFKWDEAIKLGCCSGECSDKQVTTIFVFGPTPNANNDIPNRAIPGTWTVFPDHPNGGIAGYDKQDAIDVMKSWVANEDIGGGKLKDHFLDCCGSEGSDVTEEEPKESGDLLGGGH